MDREQFRIHMGILGMESAFFLSDRIFSMLDEDGDEIVKIPVFSLFKNF